jgi:hypothetical protein
MKRLISFLSPIPARAALVALLALSPSLALAKPGEVSCKALADRLLAERMTPATKVIEDGPGCVVTKLKFAMGQYRGWTVDRLTVSGPDFRKLGKGKPFPTALRVEAQGVRFAPDVDDSHSRYLIQAQQHPFDARLSYDWDKATRRLHLRELALDDPRTGLIELSMDADLDDLDTRTTPPAPKDFGIRHVRMVIDNNGLFEGMLLPPVLAMIPSDQDPAVEIPKAQARELAQIRKLPSSVIDEASKAALSRFVNDFPHPKGRVEIDQTFDTPLRLEDLQAVLAVGKPTWFQGSRLQVRYEASTSRYGSTPQGGTGR